MFVVHFSIPTTTCPSPGRDEGKCNGYKPLYTGPVGSIIYADLYGSIKIKFTVLIRDTDQ